MKWGFALLLASVAVAGRQQTPVFRTDTTLIPIDVRVLDRKGKPIQGLTQADFTIREDGAPQTIKHFSATSLAPSSPETTATLHRSAPTTATLTATLTPQKARVFLLVLGRGNLQKPSNGVDAAIDFVRHKLLPQDQVAVLAWNRATDFTNDHAKVAAALEAFRDRYDYVETAMRKYFEGPGSGFFSPAKGSDLPQEIQVEIDRIFGAMKVGVREVPPGKVESANSIAADVRATVEAQQRALMSADDVKPRMSDATDGRLRGLTDMTLDEFAAARLQTIQDLGRIFTGVDYLRYVDGEKHLLFVTERGLFLPRLENDDSLAAVANDARVVIDTIQTGGLGMPPPPAAGSIRATAGASGAAVRFAQTFDEQFAIQSLREVSELTGGLSSVYGFADKALDRINDATASGYLLGYYPTNTKWDGRYRRVTITVNRPGATVLYRRGYFGQPQIAAPNLRRSMTYGRIVSAANYAGDIRDIKFGLKAAPVAGQTATVQVDVTLDISTVSTAVEGDRHVGAIDIAIFCADADQSPVGDLWQRIDLKLSEDDYRSQVKKGMTYSAQIPVKGRVTVVKAVIYDYGADRVGSALAKLTR